MATAPQAPQHSNGYSRYRVPPLLYSGRWTRQPPVWREGRFAGEYVRLLRDPVFQGIAVPNGKGRPVLLVPGFLAGDSSLSVMRSWLERVGYRPELTGISINVRYSEVVVKDLTLRLVDLFAWLGRRVTVIGHSRGGILAKVLSHRHPQMVEQVITLGSPLAGPYDVHPLTMAGVRLAHAFNLVRYGRTSDIERRFLHDLQAEPKVPVTSIYSKTDGIVHWEACLRADTQNIEVQGSHVGLGVNPEVFRILARLLPGPARRVANATAPSSVAAGAKLYVILRGRRHA